MAETKAAPAGSYEDGGFARVSYDPVLARWAEAVLPHARAAVADPDNAHWHVCEGTWFVGVDALANGPDGAVGASGPLAGRAVDRLRDLHGPLPDLHPAQVSVIHPGYPRPRAGESDAAFGYRARRDAAHVDGVLAEGPERRRFVREPHAFILGLPLTEADAEAAPLVVWAGSHEIMRAAFREAFADVPPERWGEIDVTDIYGTARRRVFETCPRVPLPARPGEAVLVHRLALHGVAPWASGAGAGPDGRMIAYFRPLIAGGVSAWLAAP